MDRRSTRRWWRVLRTNWCKPLFSSHMLGPFLKSLEENTETCAAYLARMAKLNMTIEIELGCTGGEEDVDNSDMDASELYTSPEDVAYAYEKLNAVSPRFTIAASFGNVHGVYQAGNVVLTQLSCVTLKHTVLRSLALQLTLLTSYSTVVLVLLKQKSKSLSVTALSKMNIDIPVGLWMAFGTTELRTVTSYKAASLVTQLAKLCSNKKRRSTRGGHGWSVLQWLLSWESIRWPLSQQTYGNFWIK